MKTTQKATYKIISIILAITMVILVTPSITFGLNTTGDTRVADPSTMNDWKAIFGESVGNTENAGAIWTDKSVFTSLSDFRAEGGLSSVTMQDENNNFLVALSAIASNKSITGYSHIPTDTILVLDISRSMGTGYGNNDAIDDLITAANAAIKKLQGVNNYNRVGVVLYSGNYTSNTDADEGDAIVLLPLDRYSHNSDRYLVKGTKSFSVGNDYTTAESIEVNSNVKNSSGGNAAQNEREVYGGTFIQGGIYAAMNEFLSTEDTVIEGSGFQAGTQRMPIMVLMSDGLPTIATSNYMGVNGTIGTSDLGNGSSPEDELASAIPFVTQLTAAYAKARIEDHYNRDSMFYTLGFNIEKSPVLNPEDSNTTLNGHWITYHNTYDENANENVSMQLAIGQKWVSTNSQGGNWRPGGGNGGGQQGYYTTEYVTIAESPYELNQNYVSKYFTTDNSLTAAFDEIVDQIIIQSLYYPTFAGSNNYNMDGYLEFIDDIGQYMEVKGIQGIQLGNTLFTGQELAKAMSGGSLGSVERPTELGNTMIQAVQTRLGIATIADANELVQKAWAAGQLAYNKNTGEFSNYIGWYADANGKYLDFASDNDTTIPEGAVFYNKSYGYLGEVSTGHKKSDMMFVSVQIHTRIATDTHAVIFRIPASLIPTVSYEVSLTGDSLENPGAITLDYANTTRVDTTGDGIYDSEYETTPMALLYEVGLKETINELTVADIVKDGYAYEENGKYYFYTNRWSAEDLDHEHPSVAINTVSFFEPSKENERYYYTTNTEVLVKTGTDTYEPYTEQTKAIWAEGTYYRAIPVFEYNDQVTEGNAIVHIHYEEISEAALSLSEPYTDENEDITGWYIPKGIIHRMLDPFVVGKGGFTDETKTEVLSNLTGTLIYANYPRVESIEDIPSTANTNESSYYADVVLGNNGRMSVTAAQGIEVTKSLDVTLQDLSPDTVFTFDITAENALAVEGQYRLIILNADGTQKSVSDITFASGSESVYIKAGESAYLLDLPTGAEYTVTERTSAGDTYQVATINGVAADEFNTKITANVINEAAFINTLKPPVSTGSLIVEKQVSHPFGVDYTPSPEPEFSFKLTFTRENEPPTEETVTLKAGQTATFADLPLGTTVTITEQDIPNGFTPDATVDTDDDGIVDTKTITISEEQNYVVSFNNSYTPESVSPTTVTVNGTKIFTGRQNDEWLDTDAFTFRLEKKVGTEWETITIVENNGTIPSEVTVTKEDSTFDFSKWIHSEVYNAVGTYSYRISEIYSENPYEGITFDKSVHWFDIVVTDVDMDGSLEISSVNGFNNVVVNKNNDNWTVSTQFNNVYAPSGSDSVTVSVNKTILDASVLNQADSTQSKEGYLFGLYQGEDLIQTFPETSAQGETSLTLTFGAADIGKDIDYTLKEIVHDTPIPGIEYSTQQYYITVEVTDNTKGGVSATVYAIEDKDGAEETGGEQVAVEFINTYTPESANLQFSGIKTLKNRDMADGEFSFELYKVEGTENELLETVQNLNGTFTFNELTFTTVGTFKYLIVEKKGTDSTITYSEKEYYITVTVTDDNGVLQADYTLDNGEETIEFENTYNAPPVNPPVNPPVKPPVNPPKNPETSDRFHWALWISALSVLGIATVSLISEKKKTQE